MHVKYSYHCKQQPQTVLLGIRVLWQGMFWERGLVCAQNVHGCLLFAVNWLYLTWTDVISLYCLWVLTQRSSYVMKCVGQRYMLTSSHKWKWPGSCSMCRARIAFLMPNYPVMPHVWLVAEREDLYEQPGHWMILRKNGGAVADIDPCTICCLWLFYIRGSYVFGKPTFLTAL